MSQSVPRDDNLRLRPTINVYFFLDIGYDALQPSENSNQSHMVSYCSAIKAILNATVNQISEFAYVICHMYPLLTKLNVK